MTTPCPWCGARVEVGNTGLVVVFCTAKLTPYTRPHQTTGVVGHTHGLGYPPHRPR